MNVSEMTLDTAINELHELYIYYDGSERPSIFSVYVHPDCVHFMKNGFNGDLFPTGYSVPLGTSVRDTIKEIVKETSLHLVTAEAAKHCKPFGMEMKRLGRMDGK